MAAKFISIVATFCYVAIFVQESSGSCIRRGGLSNDPDNCLCEERYAPESSLDCSPISRNSVRDPYESSYDDEPSPSGRGQTSCSCSNGEMAMSTIPRRSCPMHNYVLEDTPVHEQEPCKAYGVLVDVPKPQPKAVLTSTSHKYEVEKTLEQRREKMEQRRAYGVAVAVPKRITTVRAGPEVSYDYKVETPKQANIEDRCAYGVAVMNVATQPERCLPCMEDDNTPDEGFHEPQGSCCPCVDEEPSSHVPEPQSASMPCSGGCKSCAMSRGTQAGGFYYGNSRSSSSCSCQSFEHRYEGRRNSQATSRVSFVSLPSVGKYPISGRGQDFEDEDYNSQENGNDYTMEGDEESDSEFGGQDSHSMGCMKRGCDSKDGNKSDFMMDDDEGSYDEEDTENRLGSPRTGTGKIFRPCKYLKDSSDEEDNHEGFSGGSYMAQSSIGFNDCACNDH